MLKHVTIAGKWEQLRGLDGGDMHFIYLTNDRVLFISHGFSCIWRSENGGKSWEMIKQKDFVDVHFYDMAELDGKLYAGSNKGLWYSEDRGKTWMKIPTIKDVDDGRYHAISLAVYDGKLFFAVVLDKPYRHENPGDSKLYYLENKQVKEFSIPTKEEITISARDPYLLVSGPYSGLYVYSNGS